MIIGFLIAAYAIIANDAIQTFGTFLASNSHRPWWILWLFVSIILLATLFYGWAIHDDVSYGRLTKFPLVENGISLLHVIPPILILVLTRFGIPVSTTFLILVVFGPQNLNAMLVKSITGYIVAFIVGVIVYASITRLLKEYLRKPLKHSRQWVVAQWFATGFLWAQWLIQDLANIYVYLPRTLSFIELFITSLVLVGLLAILFQSRGGNIQKIVLSKTNVTDIRAATIIDILLGLILFIFKEYNNVPMSTTWVFIGLLAGRELAMNYLTSDKPMLETSKIILSDLAKVIFGLVLSVALALSIPYLNNII